MWHNFTYFTLIVTSLVISQVIFQMVATSELQILVGILMLGDMIIRKLEYLRTVCNRAGPI